MFNLVAPGDNGIIEPPSEDEDGSEYVVVGTWALSEEDDVKQGMVDPSNGGKGGERMVPEPVSASDLEVDGEDNGAESDV